MISSPSRLETEFAVDRNEDESSAVVAEQFAIDYIDEQLLKARRSLRRTRTFCLVTVFVILGYMSFVTIALRNRLLRPEAAAEMAAYYFSKFATEDNRVLSGKIADQSQKATSLLSSSAGAIPTGDSESARMDENASGNGDSLKVEAEVAAYVRGFVSQHRGNLRDILWQAQHPKSVQQLSDELDQEIRERLPSRVKYGHPNIEYMSYVDKKLTTLEELESQFDRLAHADDLSPYERTVRHIIASTMGNARQGS